MTWPYDPARRRPRLALPVGRSQPREIGQSGRLAIFPLALTSQLEGFELVDSSSMQDQPGRLCAYLQLHPLMNVH